ncbi:MAG: outer membrane protein assembly factor BamB [Capsulimonas sp.]|jgi:outer membrane protein assembly factor BamB|nr:outer membrane protein assembly factor BamB [Capsulimonas sp.]
MNIFTQARFLRVSLILIFFLSGSAITRAAPHSEKLWEVPAAGLIGHPVFCGDTVLYRAGASIVGLEVRTGRELWRRDFSLTPSGNSAATSNPTPPERYVISVTPVSKFLALIAASSGASGGKLYCVNSATGAVRWAYDASAGQNSSLREPNQLLSVPVVWRNRALLRTQDNLLAVDLATGDLFWSKALETTFRIPRVPTSRPAIDGNSIYLNSDFGLAYAFDPLNGAMKWRTPTAGMKAVSGPAVLSMNFIFTFCSPLAYQDRLIISDGAGYVYALGKTDGAVLWRIKLGNVYQISARDGAIYLATTTGFYQVNARSGKTLRRYPAPNGFLSCAIVGNSAVLVSMPRDKEQWQAFDLVHWKTKEINSGFPGFSATVANGMVCLDGYVLQGSTYTAKICAYQLGSQIAP